MPSSEWSSQGSFNQGDKWSYASKLSSQNDDEYTRTSSGQVIGSPIAHRGPYLHHGMGLLSNTKAKEMSPLKLFPNPIKYGSAFSCPNDRIVNFIILGSYFSILGFSKSLGGERRWSQHCGNSEGFYWGSFLAGLFT